MTETYPHISARIICDSIHLNGSRLTTFELTYPRYIHCFDDQTEVLCRANEKDFPVFRPFKDAQKKNAYVGQVHIEDDEGLSIDFVKPNEWINQESPGSLLYFENQRLSFAVTDEHRLLVGSRKKDRHDKEIILAKELLGDHTQKRVYKHAVLRNQRYMDPAEAKLLAYFVADGHLPRHGNQAIFRFRKARKIVEVRRLLEILGIPYDYRIHVEDTGDTTALVFDRSFFPLAAKCYHRKDEMRQKCLPAEIFNMDMTAFSAFKEGLLESDGCVENEEYNTTSELLIEQLQAIFHVHGCAFHIKQYNVGLFKVKFLREDSAVIRKDKHQVEERSYQGRVFCCSVPSGLLMVRRNGIVHISGNCEIMTHRVISRNAQSSRAIPVKRRLANVREKPVVPIRWGANQAGMQAKDAEVEDPLACEGEWHDAAIIAAMHAEKLMELGLHKQWANRLLEPFDTITVVTTGTKWENLFGLRCHPDAQPEFQYLAWMMADLYYWHQDDLPGWCALKRTPGLEVPQKPRNMEYGQWHLPYVNDMERQDTYHCYGSGASERLLQFSAARCARVSYLNHDKTEPDPEKDIALHDRLLEDGHMSPFEHQACAIDSRRPTHGNFDLGWEQYRKILQKPEIRTFDYVAAMKNRR